jgi:ATP-dependent exoDNAse (exonuclease V) beta subunit
VKNFVVYKSSAGSGKTFTLVKEYLRLALYDKRKLNENYKAILAVTFTNKAAAEMKTRVIEALHQISASESFPKTGEILCEELQIEQSDLQKRAGIVLKSILHNYSDLSIGTIDSFTHKIVKTFAHDMKLPVNFNIETDTEAFYDKVISVLFSKIGEDPYISKLLKEFALNKAENDAGWDPEKQIRNFSALLLKENSSEYTEQLLKLSTDELDDIRKQFFEFIQHYKTNLKNQSQQALILIKQKGLSDDDFKYKAAGPQNFFKKCFNLSVTIEDAEGSRIVNALEKNEWSTNKSEALESILPRLDEIARNLIQFIKENFRNYSLCSILGKQMYPLMLLKKIEEISREQKDEERIVFISDFNRKIFEIIQNEPAPFIYERLGERYRHFLLDEFQDTSSLQWQNILPLLDNSLANGWYNMLVGDGKQSIYRWRNANVKQFVKLPAVEKVGSGADTSERAGSLSRNFEARLLDTNYRSLKNIIEFNNSLFLALSEQLLQEDGKSIYTDQVQKTLSGKTSEGYITLNAGKTERDLLSDKTFDISLKYISDALNNGFEYKDICILCRKKEHGNQMANYLVEKNIPVVSSDSLLIRNNTEVQVVLAWLKYLSDRKDFISATVILNYLRSSGRIDADKMHEFTRELGKQSTLFEMLKRLGIELGTGQLSAGNLFDQCLVIINALELNKTAYHYVRFFLDEVHEFLTQKNSNLSWFFQWWERRSTKASLIIPENTNAVKIMTIHSSKGLEFPVVIIPYCNWIYNRSEETWVNVPGNEAILPVSVVNLSGKSAAAGFEQEHQQETQDQVLDNLNLLYVAFTRAVERLHIITLSSKSNNKPTVATWIEQYFAENQKLIGDCFYEIGKAEPKVSKEKEKNTGSFSLEIPEYNQLNNKVKIKSSFPIEDNPFNDARQQGLVLHEILSKIIKTDDVPKAVERSVLEGIINKTETAFYTQLLEQIILREELKQYYSEGIQVRNENELITSNGEILRPDRVVIDGNKATVIDYKTGKEHKKHYEQLIKYGNALIAMGYANPKKLLVYLEEHKVIEVA